MKHHIRSNLSNRGCKQEGHFMQINNNRRVQKPVVERKHAGSLFFSNPRYVFANLMAYPSHF